MPLDDVAAGDLLLVASGDVVPVDGTVASAAAVLDESALTGEARPAERIRGDQVRSGVVNVGAPFDLRASDTAAEQHLRGHRPPGQRGGELPGAVRPGGRPVRHVVPAADARGRRRRVGGWAAPTAPSPSSWWRRPCPLILAAPVALVSGLSAAARRGVVVKSGGVLERLARCTTLILDKTGTLTVGQPQVTAVIPASPGSLDADGVLSAGGVA